MHISPWLRNIQQRLRHSLPTKRLSRSNDFHTITNQIEALENRVVLSVSALFIDGELTITSDGQDDITVREDPNANGNLQVVVNNAPLNTVNALDATAIRSIVINGGEGDNVIDLSTLNSVLLDNPNGTSLTVNAGDGNDFVLGSLDLDESILGNDGDDTITSQGGNDTLDGGNGDDVVNGGAGDDSISGGDGTDLLTGDAGDDTINGGDGNDTINGSTGNDSIFGDDGFDLINGNTGDDVIEGGSGNDTINGNDGDDDIMGRVGDDSLNGNAGNDTVSGNFGNDTVNGNDGDDNLNGGIGDDVLSGNLGNDRMTGGAGNDTMSGNEGNDNMFGGAGRDEMGGNDGNDTIRGQGGADTIRGNDGNDSMTGGIGNDLIEELAPPPQLPPGSIPTLSVADAPSVTEGASGTVTATFTVTLSAASSTPVTVDFTTLDGGASVANGDYSATSGTLTFNPGDLTETVSVTINGDLDIETDESVFVMISNAMNADIADPIGSVTVTNDDLAQQLVGTTLGGQLFEVDPATGMQLNMIGSLKYTNCQWLSLGPGGQLFGIAANNLVTVDAINGTLTQVGQFSPVAPVEGALAFDDTTNTMHGVFSGQSPDLVTFNTTTGALTSLGDLLVNGAAFTSFSIDINGLAFRNGLLYSMIPGTLTGPETALADQLFTINPATREVNFVGPLGVDFNQGQGSIVYDASRDVLLLSNTLGPGQVQFFEVDPDTAASTPLGGTIVYSGLEFVPIPPPSQTQISINDVNVVEGNAGTTMATFTVNLSQPETTTVTVDFESVDDRAIAGSDFTAAMGTVTFAPGTTTQTITVSVTTDLSEEPDEQFFVRLTNATSGIGISDPLGIGQIANDDVDMITATPEDDTLIGGDGNDTLRSGDGNDSVTGNSGDDLIEAGNGTDIIRGGGGDDTLIGGAGDDRLDGQGGNDDLFGDSGDDTFIWDGRTDASDTFVSTSGANRVEVRGGATKNNFSVAQNSDNLMTITDGISTLILQNTITEVFINAGGGNDMITIGDLSLVRATVLQVNGELGNDTISAAGADLGNVLLEINGNEGNDTITGSDDDDSLNGGAGNDNVDGGAGNDIINGGDNEDRLSGGMGDDLISGENGSDTLFGNEGADTLSGNAHDDRLEGNDGDDSLQGNAGDDTLAGDSGNDTLQGGIGFDKLFGGRGNDILDGGGDDDTLRGQNDDDSLVGGDGNDMLFGDAGNDTAIGGDGNDTITGGTGDDGLNGGDGNDRILGNAGNETILGGDGADTLLGGSGADIILGQEGDDTIDGQGNDNDTVSGAEGTDQIADSDDQIDEEFTLSLTVLAALDA